MTKMVRFDGYDFIIEIDNQELAKEIHRTLEVFLKENQHEEILLEDLYGLFFPQDRGIIH